LFSRIGRNGYPRANRVAITPRSHEFHFKPVSGARRRIAKQQGLVSDASDHNVDLAVAIEIGKRRASMHGGK